MTLHSVLFSHPESLWWTLLHLYNPYYGHSIFWHHLELLETYWYQLTNHYLVVGKPLDCDFM